MPLWTPEFDAFVAPARARASLWRLGAGVTVVLAVYLASLGALFGGIALLGGEAAMVAWMQRVQIAAGPTATLLLLATFGGLLLGLWAALRLVHRRGLGSTLGPRARSLRDFRRAGGVTLLGLLGALALFLPGTELMPNLPLAIWASFLPLALVAIALQTGAEELLFRGYLQQQLAARFASPLAWMVLPSVLFGLAHYDPGAAGDSAPLVALAAGLFGLLAADLTRRTGNIGAAWGMHFANNCIAILGISVQGTIPGLSLATTEMAISDTASIAPLLVQDMGVTLVIYGAVRWAVAR
jgi:membrane protease YdiL (CAAX protease family)